jgi:alanyl-tRNA synthetase
VPTERLYYTDCYLREFEARVVSKSDEGRRIYLDRTAFYPASGGQPHDIGQLGGVRLLEVVDEEFGIAHVLEAPLQANVAVGHIDWNRRYDHMQQHTGQHLLSAVLLERFGYRTLSFHMGSEVSSIEIATKELPDTQIDEAEEQVNAIVREARPVSIQFEDAGTARDLRKPSDRSGTLRIVEIQGLDRSACGGTHVRSTAEIGPVQIRKLERIRGNLRLEFVCGIRALRRAKQDYRIAAQLARQGAVAIDDLPQNVGALRQRLTETEKNLQKLTLDLARRDGNALYEATPPSADGIRKLLLRVPAVNEVVRAQVEAFAARGKALALVIGADPPGVLLACSPDSGMHAGSILKEALSNAGGRGGGSATLGQGSLPNPSLADSLAATLGMHDSKPEG